MRGERTLGVLTKLDINTELSAKRNNKKKIMNEDYQLKLGWSAVKGRS